MSYFAPYIDESGLHLPTYNDILEKRMDDARNIYGQDIYLANDSADYQLIAVESLYLYDAIQAIQLAYNQFCPTTAIGVGLSNLVQINGISRRSASYSTCDVVLTGTTSATIVNGVVTDISGNKWNLPTPIILQAAGSPLGSSYELITTVTCQTIGEITAMPGDITEISTPVAGWTGVTNPTAAIPGLAVETDSELRERQLLSVALPSQTMLAGTIAAIASLANVTRYRVYENATNVTTYGSPGVPFEGAPEHSITAVVEGGIIDDIAMAIYDNRGLGCYTNGDVVTNIVDSETGTITPIRFFRPEYVSIYVNVEVRILTGWADEDVNYIRTAIANYINSLGIGETLAVSSIISAAIDTMADKTKPTFSIRSLEIASPDSPFIFVTNEIVVAYNENVQGFDDEAYITITLV